MTTTVRSAPPTANGVSVEASDLHLAFGPTQALRGVDLVLRPGELVALMGPSGSGKSTLLHCLAGILRPQRGCVRHGEVDLTQLSEARRSDYRLRRMGFVFQFGDLIPELTLRENVRLPLELLRTDRRESARRADVLLRQLGVAEVADRRAGEVSGGEAQRAAVARALAHEPQVLFADEPTGSLDTVTGDQVLDAMLGLARACRTTVLLVTHDNRVAAHADRLVTMRDGRVVDAAGTRP